MSICLSSKHQIKNIIKLSLCLSFISFSALSRHLRLFALIFLWRILRVTINKVYKKDRRKLSLDIKHFLHNSKCVSVWISFYFWCHMEMIVSLNIKDLRRAHSWKLYTDFQNFTYKYILIFTYFKTLPILIDVYQPIKVFFMKFALFLAAPEIQ